MKALKIKIRSREQADAAFIAAWKDAAKNPHKMKTVTAPEVYFTSLEAVRNLLTDKRLELLRLIRKHSPRSINQLAALAGRDFKNVHTDIMILKHYGLVQFDQKRRASKTARRELSAPYQAIDIHAPV